MQTNYARALCFTCLIASFKSSPQSPCLSTLSAIQKKWNALMDLRPLSRVLKIKVNQVDLKTPEKLTEFPIYMYKSLNKTFLNKSDIYTGKQSCSLRFKALPSSLYRFQEFVEVSQFNPFKPIEMIIEVGVWFKFQLGNNTKYLTHIWFFYMLYLVFSGKIFCRNYSPTSMFWTWIYERSYMYMNVPNPASIIVK